VEFRFQITLHRRTITWKSWGNDWDIKPNFMLEEHGAKPCTKDLQECFGYEHKVLKNIIKEVQNLTVSCQFKEN
jgi:hypothetical protein